MNGLQKGRKGDLILLLHTYIYLHAYVRLTAALRKKWYLQKNLIYPRRVIEPCWAVTTVRRSVALLESLTNHLELKSKKCQKIIYQVFLEHLTQQYSHFWPYVRFSWSGPSIYIYLAGQPESGMYLWEQEDWAPLYSGHLHT